MLNAITADIVTVVIVIFFGCGKDCSTLGSHISGALIVIAVDTRPSIDGATVDIGGYIDRCIDRFSVDTRSSMYRSI